MQSRPTQPPWDEWSSSSLWTAVDTPNVCFAGFKTGCAADVSGNKSSSASTWARSSTSSMSGSKLPFISARTWFNHVILKSGWSSQSFRTSWRKSLNRSIPSELQHLSSVFRWLAGSDLDVLVYFGKIEDFQCSGTVSSLRTKRISPSDFL
jgi:hypothetical protein